MNIFVLSSDPVDAAQMHCDRHVIKMILESGQMLCAAHWIGWRRHLGSDKPMKRVELDGWLRGNIPQHLQPPWKVTHEHHPCTQWTQHARQNYVWHSKMGLALCEEYTRRYGKIHKCETVHRWLEKNMPPMFETAQDAMTQHAICMPDAYKVVDDPVESYRNYYREDKVRFAKWKNTSEPIWFTKTGSVKI